MNGIASMYPQNIMANGGQVCRSLPKIFTLFCHSNPLKHNIRCNQRAPATGVLWSTYTRRYSDKTSKKDVQKDGFSGRILEGPSLEHFIANSFQHTQSTSTTLEHDIDEIPYIKAGSQFGRNRNVYFETYGCQMNVNDTEIAWAVLNESGFNKTDNIKESDVVLIMTCSIREGAEQKIWKRLEYLRFLKNKRRQDKSKPPMKIGILGCMAERLKKKIVEQDKSVDLVCGPDAYRDLPRMLALTEGGQTAVNVLLSLDETYADITPVRLNMNSPSAFVSIMRGCDNMCSYCIVPFTRGRERSRPIDSIVDEVQALAEQGVKEVTLLGQNVNSYRDLSETVSYRSNETIKATNLSKGFKTIYKPKVGGRRFSDLLDKVSKVAPEMRIRFTSPHPKDFPDEVLYLIRDRPNVCNQLHLPAQSGSSRMLEAMRRGYTRDSYLDLVSHVRSIIPDVSLSSDFIAGFCGETEEDHVLTASLMEQVGYQFAFCFPYSMRGKTHAYHRLEDDVPDDVKSRRHMELIDIFRAGALRLNKSQIGKLQLVLTEGVSKKSQDDLAGRNDANTKVIFPKIELPESSVSDSLKPVTVGDYVAVKITEATSQVLKGVPLYHSSLTSTLTMEEVKSTLDNRSQTYATL